MRFKEKSKKWVAWTLVMGLVLSSVVPMNHSRVNAQEIVTEIPESASEISTPETTETALETTTPETTTPEATTLETTTPEATTSEAVAAESAVALAVPPVTTTTILVSEDSDSTLSASDTLGLTFSENEAFSKAITSITIDAGANILDQSVITPSKISLPGTLFAFANGVTSQTFKITINATGYQVAPIYQTLYANSSWNLVWNDEFSGATLDTTKWDYQNGTGSDYGLDGWGNNEQEYYDSDNITVGDGRLTIEAKQEQVGNKPYTSGRIRTMGQVKAYGTKEDTLFSKKYGRVEAKIKTPAGSGMWPAFWMLPDPHDNPYGGWASSGEIDIMEVRGRILNEVAGTLHYGNAWPNNVSSGGTYQMPAGTNTTDYHIYAIEWEPTEIRWYCDGQLYKTVNNWFSRGAGETANYAFPAPFDEEFYILLNLAVGGNFDGNVTPQTTDFPAKMEVDYVRVYDKVGGYGDLSNITEKEVPKDEAGAALYVNPDINYNYIADTNFDTVNTTPITTGVMDVTSKNWYLLAGSDFGATASFAKNKVGATTFADVNVTNKGIASYSVQLIQHLPLVKGYAYELSFDAKAPEARTLIAKLGGDGDNGWATYSNSYETSLGGALKHYSYKFMMNATTDPTARLEINLGTGTGVASIANVSVKRTVILETDGQDDAKDPMANGNYVYNGTFTLGSTKMLFWHVFGGAAVVANSVAQVTKTSGNPQAEMYQLGMHVTGNDTYSVTLDAKASSNGSLKVQLSNQEGTLIYGTKTLAVTTALTNLSCEMTIPAGVNDSTARISIFTDADSTQLDNVVMLRLTNNNIDYTGVDFYPVSNGDFFAGLDGWNIWSEGSGYISKTVENGALKATTNCAPTDNFWAVGVQSAPMSLKKGFTYVVSFDINGDTAKKIKLEIGSLLKEELSLVAGAQTVTREIEVKADAVANISMFFAVQSGEYHFTLDNVRAVVKGTIPAGNLEPVSLAPQVAPAKATKSLTILQSGNAVWEAASKVVYVNDIAVAANLVSYVAGGIRLDGSLFQAEGVYRIRVKAEGFASTKTINQNVIAAAGNLFINGNFSDGVNTWGSWFANGCGALTAVDGEAKVDFTWHEGNFWDLQLFKENVTLPGGHYILTFDARATIPRPIQVQIAGLRDDFVTLGTTNKTYTIVYENLNPMTAKFLFMFGNVNGKVSNVSNPHSIFLDNISLVSATDAEVQAIKDANAPILSVQKATIIGKDVTLVYTENTVWENKALTIRVNDQLIPTTSVIVDKVANTLTLKGIVFGIPGNYKISAQATDYPATEVTQPIMDLDGNLISNSTFDSVADWGTYAEDTNCGTITIEKGVAKVNYIQSMYHEAWKIYISWAMQLIKENIVTEEGKTYILSFEAETTLARPIAIETSDVGGTKKATIELSGEGKHTYTLEVTPGKTTHYSIKFLMGAMGSVLENLPVVNPHTIRIDNITLIEKGSVPVAKASESLAPKALKVVSEKANQVAISFNKAVGAVTQYVYFDQVLIAQTTGSSLTLDGLPLGTHTIGVRSDNSDYQVSALVSASVKVIDKSEEVIVPGNGNGNGNNGNGNNNTTSTGSISTTPAATSTTPVSVQTTSGAIVTGNTGTDIAEGNVPQGGSKDTTATTEVKPEALPEALPATGGAPMSFFMLLGGLCLVIGWRVNKRVRIGVK